MRLAHTDRRRWLLSTLVIIAALIGTTALTIARAKSAVSITVTNSAQRAIVHLYLAPSTEPNNWSADQLNGSTIPSGGSHELSNVSCNGTIRVIAEDDRGCFVYNTVSCDANQNVEISDNTPRDCGH
jgi:hypothetical protein